MGRRWILQFFDIYGVRHMPLTQILNLYILTWKSRRYSLLKIDSLLPPMQGVVVLCDSSDSDRKGAMEPFTSNSTYFNPWDCMYEYNMGAGVELSYTWAQTITQMRPLSFSYTSLFCILWRNLTVDHTDPECRSRCKSSLRRSTPAHNYYNGTG